MSDIASTDIWRAANMMLELYGGGATLKAALRADALLEQRGLFRLEADCKGDRRPVAQNRRCR